jgi:hypothetical protein
VRGDGNKEIKRKRKTNNQVEKKQNKETNKKVSKIYTGRDSELINAKLKRH